MHGLLIMAELDQLTLGLQQWLPLAYDPKLPHADQPTVLAALRHLQDICVRVGPAEDHHIRQQRPDCLPHSSIGTSLHTIGTIIQQACTHLISPPTTAALLIIRYVLPDGHGAPQLRVNLQDETGWREIYKGSPKPDPRSPGSYATQMAVFQTNQPQRLRITGGGYGGIAVCWCEMITASGRWILGHVASHEGAVDDPTRLMSDDSWHCRFGSDDILAQLLDIPHAPKTGTIEGPLVNTDH